jgi:hypothetical protein
MTRTIPRGESTETLVCEISQPGRTHPSLLSPQEKTGWTEHGDLGDSTESDRTPRRATTREFSQTMKSSGPDVHRLPLGIR